jgi:hypothetical protein
VCELTCPVTAGLDSRRQAPSAGLIDKFYPQNAKISNPRRAEIDARSFTGPLRNQRPLSNRDFMFRKGRKDALPGLTGQRGACCGTAAGLESRYCVGSLESGSLHCQAYEAYLDLHVPASISFASATRILGLRPATWIAAWCIPHMFRA